MTGLFIALLVPFGRLVALWLVPHDIAARARCLRRVAGLLPPVSSFGPQRLPAAGLVLAAAGTSLYEGVDPFTPTAVIDPHSPAPSGHAWQTRALWALGMGLAER